MRQSLGLASLIFLFTFVVPFSREGKFRGTVNMDVRLDQLTARVARLDLPKGDVAITSPTGLLISFPPDPSRVMRSSIFDLARDVCVPFRTHRDRSVAAHLVLSAMRWK